jgi:hypothetical protein
LTRTFQDISDSFFSVNIPFLNVANIFEPTNVAENSIPQCLGITLHFRSIPTDKLHGICQIAGIIKNAARIFKIFGGEGFRNPEYTV